MLVRGIRISAAAITDYKAEEFTGIQEDWEWSRQCLHVWRSNSRDWRITRRARDRSPGRSGKRCWWVCSRVIKVCLSLEDQLVHLRDVEIIGSPVSGVGGNVHSLVGATVGVLHVANVGDEALPAEVLAAALACEY